MSRERKMVDTKSDEENPEDKNVDRRPDNPSYAGQPSSYIPTSEASSVNKASRTNQESTSGNLQENHEYDNMTTIDQVPDKIQLSARNSIPSTSIAANVPSKMNPKAKRNYTKNPNRITKKVCLKSDNPDLDMEKAELGKPDPMKTRIKIRCTDGTYKKGKWRSRKEEKWDDKTWVSALNKWRTQRFSIAFKGDKSDTKPARARWSYAEFQLLEWQIRKKVTGTGAYLNGKDFQEFATVHNKRFEGKETKVGERLVNGKTTTTIQVIGARTPHALKILYDKTPEFKVIVRALVKQCSTGTNNEEREDAKDSEDGKDDEKNSLEEDSDDEIKGCRAVAQPTG